MSIRLERLDLAHLDGIMTWVNDPAVTFYFARHGEEITRKEEQLFIERAMTSQAERLYSIFEEAEEGESLASLDGEPESLPGYRGQIGLSQIYWPARTARLGIMMPRYAWGRGVAQKAAAAMLDLAFNELDLNKIWLIVRSDNAKGLYLWTKVGFRAEGVLRQEYFSQGRFHDMIRFAVLAEEWPRPTSSPESE